MNGPSSSIIHGVEKKCGLALRTHNHTHLYKTTGNCAKLAVTNVSTAPLSNWMSDMLSLEKG